MKKKYTKEEFLEKWSKACEDKNTFINQNNSSPASVYRYIEEYIKGRVLPETKAGRVKRSVALPDCHLEPGADNPISELAFRVVEDIKPDEVILPGDFLNMDCVNPHLTNKFRIVEGKRLKEAYALADATIARLRKVSGCVVYIEGNHEDWVNQYIDRNPSVAGFLELKNNIKNADLIVSDYTDHTKNSYRICSHLDITHGKKVSKNACDLYLSERSKRSLLFANSHRIKEVSKNMEDGDPVSVWNIGCLCPINPRYTGGDLANWQNALTVIDVYPEGKFQVYIVRIVKNACCFEKKIYRL